MATLDQIKVSAKYAFPVLHHLVDTRTLPAKEVRANEAMVARMQGLRRLSTLLCPLYSEGQADQLTRGVRPCLLIASLRKILIVLFYLYHFVLLLYFI